MYQFPIYQTTTSQTYSPPSPTQRDGPKASSDLILGKRYIYLENVAFSL